MQLPVSLGELLARLDLSNCSVDEQARVRELIERLNGGTATREEDEEAWQVFVRLCQIPSA